MGGTEIARFQGFACFEGGVDGVDVGRFQGENVSSREQTGFYGLGEVSVNGGDLKLARLRDDLSVMSFEV